MADIVNAAAHLRARRPRAGQRGVRIEPRLIAAFEVFGEPVPKARPRVVVAGGRRAFTPSRTVKGEQHVQECCFVANPRLRPVEGSVGLKLRFYVGGLGRGDLDNYVKLVSDALNKIAWFDDAQVVKLDAEIETFAARPRTDVEVWLLAIPV